MTVVSDTSVLIHLARIGRFWFLRDLFSTITIPEAVWRETVEEGKDRPGAPETLAAHEQGWIKVLPVEGKSGTWRLLRRALDVGEADAIALAHQLDADLILLDEATARRRADDFERPTTGTIGVLLRAKRE